MCCQWTLLLHFMTNPANLCQWGAKASLNPSLDVITRESQFARSTVRCWQYKLWLTGTFPSFHKMSQALRKNTHHDTAAPQALHRLHYCQHFNRRNTSRIIFWTNCKMYHFNHLCIYFWPVSAWSTLDSKCFLTALRDPTKRNAFQDSSCFECDCSFLEITPTEMKESSMKSFFLFLHALGAN